MTDFFTKYGRWAVVAGASEGLGAAFAEALARRGLHLILLARREDKLQELAAELRQKFKVEIVTQAVDLANHGQLIPICKNFPEDVGLLVYNAAYAPIGYVEHVPQEDLFRIVDVNVKAPLLLAKLIGTSMIKKRKGGIVLMSSLAGTQGSPKIATYAASKAFNTVLAEGLWSEWKDYNVDVISCCAGAISTPGYEKAQSGKAPGTLQAAAVAEKALKALGTGPVVIPGFVNKLAILFTRRLFPRKVAINLMKKNTKDLT
jgi:short-subunit dehydrogenase